MRILKTGLKKFTEKELIHRLKKPKPSVKRCLNNPIQLQVSPLLNLINLIHTLLRHNKMSLNNTSTPSTIRPHHFLNNRNKEPFERMWFLYRTIQVQVIIKTLSIMHLKMLIKTLVSKWTNINQNKMHFHQKMIFSKVLTTKID